MVAESESLVRSVPGIPTPQEFEEPVSELLQYCNQGESSTEQVIERFRLWLAWISDDALLEVRAYARAQARAAWRIEVAVDAEILDRIRLRGGRGRKDEAGEGRMSAYAVAAKVAGVHERTIRLNAQIYQTFFQGVPETVAVARHSLGEKTYFQEALRADDPHAALISLAEKKNSDPSFTTYDVRRWLKVGDVEEAKRQTIPSLQEIVLKGEARKAWNRWVAATAELRRMAPELARPLNDCLKLCREEISRPEQTTKERICSLLRETPGDTCENLAQMLRLDRVKTQAILDAMVADGTLRRVPQFDDRTKLVAARGAQVWLYFFNYQPSEPTATERAEIAELERMWELPSDDEFGDRI
jgi:hypothetical protein